MSHNNHHKIKNEQICASGTIIHNDRYMWTESQHKQIFKFEVFTVAFELPI